MQHFYDGQIRRYITQMVRLMSNFSYKDGKGNLTEIPVMYGDLTRQVANIIRDNSENKIPSAPRMAVYITGLAMDTARLADSSYINKVNIREQAYDTDGNEYLNKEGKNYTVERLMPTPYTLTINVDIWSTNTDQKLQILEQILMLFNPSLEIQTTDNYIDWTSLSVVNLENLTFSSRSVPVGIDSEIDIATMIFQIPVWINPPAQVTRQNTIRNIINNIYTYSDLDSIDYDPDAFEFFADLKAQSSVIVTPNNYALRVYKNAGTVVCSPYANGNYDASIPWATVLKDYGTLDSGVSRLRLKYHGEVEDLNADVIGTLATTSDVTTLAFTIDPATLPTNTVTSVDRIINASTAKPGFNSIPNVAMGQRYLTLNEADSSSVWGINVSANDIIEYNGTEWVKSFDASSNSTREYVQNTFTTQQFKFEKGEWTDTYQGIYESGYWRLELVTTP